MSKKSGFVFFLVSVILLGAIYINYSGLFRITGMATSQTTAVNITVGNTGPTITNVSSVGTQSITESGATTVIFTFAANDIDGTANLASGVARGAFYASGEKERFNSTCALVGSVNTTENLYSCNVSLYWFDGPGTWNVNATIQDNSAAIATNTSNSFTLSSTTAFVMAPSSLTFATLGLGAVNSTSTNDPIVLNNTGNANISLGRIELTGTNLYGETNKTQFINVSNFTVDMERGGTPPLQCAVSSSVSGVRLANATATNITGAGLTRDNYTWSNGTAQRNLSFCLTNLIVANASLSQQSYSTVNVGAWTVRIG